ncbi:hypothetical protein [Nitrincola sp.]|uniref:hypothetical protein n=1 Tax=Nitrincola sp. TaxID=1926584 RepID=UPI003A949559
MNTSNFDAFNRITLHLLVKLFEVFPGHLDVDSNALGLDAKPKDTNETEDELWESMILAGNTVTWLKSEGFIEVGSVSYGGHYSQVRLTLKGLTLLGYAPPTMENDSKYQNLAEKAQSVLADGARGAVTEVVKELFVGGLRYLPQVFT